MDDRITDKPPGPEPWGDVPPWERPGGFRRDAEPHRNPLLRGLGLAAMTNLLASCSLVFLGVVSIPLTCAQGWPIEIGACLALASAVCSTAAVALGLSAWTIASRDLRQMWRGSMDPDGHPVAERARDRGMITFGLAAGLTIFWACILFKILADSL
jgi:hypothetical protein